MIKAAISAILLASTFNVPPAFAKSVSSTGDETASRGAVEMADGWRFRFGEAPQAVTSANFDDSNWERVSVPHSWNRIGAYGLDRGPGLNNEQGIGWYRLSFDAPAASKNFRQYLDFAAVAKIADVWVNGQNVGRHAGGFARFRLDVTNAWKPGQKNLIVVRADNSKPTPESATGQVIPLSGDFFVHGGIYRPVHLLQLPAASIDPLDFGGPGVYARTAELTDKQAVIDVRTRLRNHGAQRALSLLTEVRDARGKVVAKAMSPLQLVQGATDTSTRLTLTNPHRWDGRGDPYMYTVTATLRDGSKALDRVTQPLGLRTFRFDADAGFFLNGHHLKLHGVSRHQDWLNAGWALTPEQHRKDMELIEELGANTVRQAHYQHADQWSDLADQAGMVVWAELPYVTSPSLSGGKGSDELWANAETQLREQIRQTYNHPSIMMWSVGNEVDSAKGFGLEGDPPKPLALLQHLNAVAKEEDPDRPTAFADCCEGLGMIKTAGEKLAGTADLIGYNRYYGWYYPEPLKARVQFGEMLDKMHGEHPDLPISITEYGAGGAVSQHSDNVTNGFVNFVGRPHPEEYEAWVHEQAWPAINSRDFVFASWIWNMFDFSSDLRDEGDAVDLNDKGLITADRKVKKDAFWFYKVAWSEAPMVRFAGTRYVDRSYPVMSVKAYANSPRASLTVNGRVIGDVACIDDVCEWKDVPLAPGPNKAVVATVGGERKLTDTATWNGPNPENGIRIDAGSLATRDMDGKRYGSDNFVTGGRPLVLNLVGFGGRSLRPRRDVEASHPELFEYWREGEAFSYAVPLPDGAWNVTLRVFEPDEKATDGRILTVTANGSAAIEGLDVKKTAGGALRELVRTFPVTVSGGILKLDFASTGGKAAVAAIEITR